MSDIPTEFIEDLKSKVKTLNWVTIIAILGVVGLLIAVVWFILHRRKEQKT